MASTSRPTHPEAEPTGARVAVYTSHQNTESKTSDNSLDTSTCHIIQNASAAEDTETPQDTALIFKEADCISFNAATAELNATCELSRAVGPLDDLHWGMLESERTLKEALQLAKQPAWKDWSTESREHRWHFAGSTGED
jgi:hypothetical protein